LAFFDKLQNGFPDYIGASPLEFIPTCRGGNDKKASLEYFASHHFFLNTQIARL
jgi:hypothetical protein